MYGNSFHPSSSPPLVINMVWTCSDGVPIKASFFHRRILRWEGFCFVDSVRCCWVVVFGSVVRLVRRRRVEVVATAWVKKRPAVLVVLLVDVIVDDVVADTVVVRLSLPTR